MAFGRGLLRFYSISLQLDIIELGKNITGNIHLSDLYIRFLTI